MRRAAPLVAAVLAVASACSGGSGGEQAGEIHIGVDLPITGPEARAAVPALNGMRFFVQQHPRLDGFAVKLVVSDDAAGGSPDPERGARDVEAFVADPLLVAMLGPFDASVARKEIPVGNAAALAMVSPATSSPCLTRDVYLPATLNPARTAITCENAGLPSASALRPTHLNNFFRLTTTDDLQGPAAADYASKQLHLLRVAVVSDHETYGQALADGFSARFIHLGGTVVAHLDLDPAAKQVDPGLFLQAAKAAGAQAVFFGGTPGTGACAFRSQMESVFDPGQATPFLGGDGLIDPACVRDAGANSSGIFATAPIVDAASLPAAGELVAAYKRTYPNQADYGPYTLLAYDSTAAVYQAIDRAIRLAGGELPVRGNVVSQLTVAAVDGVTGTIGFDVAGDTTNRIVSIYEPVSGDPGAAWKFIDAVDYRTTLPY